MSACAFSRPGFCGGLRCRAQQRGRRALTVTVSQYSAADPAGRGLCYYAMTAPCSITMPNTESKGLGCKSGVCVLLHSSGPVGGCAASAAARLAKRSASRPWLLFERMTLFTGLHLPSWVSPGLLSAQLLRRSRRMRTAPPAAAGKAWHAMRAIKPLLFLSPKSPCWPHLLVLGKPCALDSSLAARTMVASWMAPYSGVCAACDSRTLNSDTGCDTTVVHCNCCGLGTHIGCTNPRLEEAGLQTEWYCSQVRTVRIRGAAPSSKVLLHRLRRRPPWAFPQSAYPTATPVLQGCEEMQAKVDEFDRKYILEEQGQHASWKCAAASGSQSESALRGRLRQQPWGRLPVCSRCARHCPSHIAQSAAGKSVAG